jgi:hypothetical protein
MRLQERGYKGCITFPRLIAYPVKKTGGVLMWFGFLLLLWCGLGQPLFATKAALKHSYGLMPIKASVGRHPIMSENIFVSHIHVYKERLSLFGIQSLNVERAVDRERYGLLTPAGKGETLGAGRWVDEYVFQYPISGPACTFVWDVVCRTADRVHYLKSSTMADILYRKSECIFGCVNCRSHGQNRSFSILEIINLVIQNEQHFAANDYRHKSEDSYPDRSTSRDSRSLLYGMFLLFIGCALIHLPFYIADELNPPCLTRASYLATGFVAFISIWHGINRLIDFSVPRTVTLLLLTAGRSEGQL